LIKPDSQLYLIVFLIASLFLIFFKILVLRIEALNEDWMNRVKQMKGKKKIKITL